VHHAVDEPEAFGVKGPRRNALAGVQARCEVIEAPSRPRERSAEGLAALGFTAEGKVFQLGRLEFELGAVPRLAPQGQAAAPNLNPFTRVLSHARSLPELGGGHPKNRC
jgi:hypothetical protein